MLSRIVPAAARWVVPRRPGSARPAAVAAAVSVAIVGALAGTIGPRWARSDANMMEAHTEPPLKQADRWVASSVPRDRTVVVHDALWTDLVAKDGFDPDNVVIVYKLDGDPAVHKRVKRIDYLVLPDYYYRTAAGQGQYPTAIHARDHAVPAARFGSDPASAVTVYRVSAKWSPHNG